jgi:hypothetical protein
MCQVQKPLQFCSLRRRQPQKRNSVPTNEWENFVELVAAALETGGRLRVYGLDQIGN